MKVYYQGIDGTTCYFNGLNDLKDALETEIGSFYYGNDAVSDEELDNLHKSIGEQVEKLGTGQEIECCEAFWGVAEMSKEEFDALDEFEGF